MVKIKFRYLIILGLMLSLAAPEAIAEDTNISDTFPSIGRGVRPLGMGNAFLSMKVQDENALFYNPATIRNFSNETKFTTGFLPAPVFEINFEVITLVQDILDFSDDLDNSSSDSGDVSTFEDFVDQSIGKFYSSEIRIPIFGVYNKFFALSVISDNKLGVSFRNRAFPNFELMAKSYSGIAVGGAYGVLCDTLTFGLAMKFLYAIENQQVITISDILTDALGQFGWSDWKRGLGIGVDLGVWYQFPDFDIGILDELQPTIAITYQDIGHTRFPLMNTSAGRPEHIPQSISLGFGVHPTFGPVDMSFLVDFRELNRDSDFLMKLNIGVEARFPKRYGFKPSVRVGLNQGYPTVGAGIEIWKLVWNVAFFGKEVGESTYSKGGYRFANEFTWRF